MPGPNSTVTLVRHDGSLMDATPEQAQRLQLLGYKEVTPAQNLDRLTSEAKSDYYTTPDQQLQAGLEGFNSGLTFGASDYILGDDDLKERAAYNPGTRLATETAGALLPAFLTGGESVAARFAEATPTGLLTKAAHALAPSDTLAGALTRGAVEGAAYGASGAVNHAYIDGEPITGETVLHGIGWGALVGGAMGAIGEGIRGYGEAAAESKAAELRAQEPVPVGALKTVAGSEYGALRDELTNLASNTKQAITTADSSVGEVMATLKKANTGYDVVKNFIDAEKPPHMQDVGANFNKEVGKLQGLYEKAAQAAEAGKFDKAAEAADNYASHAKGIADKLGIQIPDPAQPIMEMATMRKITSILKTLPKDVEGFAGLSAKKMEDVMAAIQVAKSLPFQNGIAEASDNFVQAIGLNRGGSEGGLREAQQMAKSLLKSEGKVRELPKEPDKGPSLGRKVAGYAVGGKAWVAARAAGLGRVGSFAAYKGVRDMVTYGTDHFAGMKAAAIAAVKEAAAQWGPSVGKTTAEAGPRAAALSYSIFGEPDKSTTDKQELAKKRAQELYSFAPIANDAMFKAVEPMSVTQPLLAKSVSKAGLAAFQAMLAMAPKDPGAQSKLKSLWSPSPVQAEVMNKQLAVFHDPVGEAVNMLRSGKIDVTKVAALQQISPNLFDELKAGMMNRLSQPKVMAKLGYDDQVFISVALGIPLHTSTTPGYISMSQQIFTDRNQPLKGNPRIGPGGGLPAPKDNPNATQSQISTER